MTSTTALHSTGSKVAQAIMMFISLAGGVMVIGGLGNATDICRKNANALLYKGGAGVSDEVKTGLTIVAMNHLQPFPTFAEPSNSEAAYDCGIHVSLDWWVVAFEVFTIIYGVLATFVPFFHSKHSVMSIFAINITLVTLITSIYVKIGYMFDGGEHSDNEMGQSTKTAAAGGIVILVANFVYLFLFGAEELNIDESSEVKIQKA